MDLIDREPLYMLISKWESVVREEVINTTEDVPTFIVNNMRLNEITRIKHLVADAPKIEPVRHGKWVVWNGMDIPENHGRHKCSECGNFAIKPKYGEEILTYRCPICGAKMDGE